MYRLILLSLFFLIFQDYVQGQNLQLDSIVNSKIGIEDPALFVGVVKDGNIIYQTIRGSISLQHKVAADENSRSNIASTAKQFTALMILDLSLKGKLSLEDDIRKYIPHLYPKVKEEIKIRHLLNHTSGIRDYCDLMSIQQDPWWRREGLDNKEVIELLMKQEDLAFDPGSDYTYSNSGYILLAEIIEIVSEESFHKYSNRFFESLGMNNTSFLKNYMHVIPNQALPYSDWGDGVWQQYPMMTSLYGDGFLFTTLKDQLLYEQLIQKAESGKDSLLIQSQLPIANSEIKKYGYGLELSDRLNYKSVHHAGGTGSYNSQMVRYPEEKLSIFIMSNNSKVWSGGLADEIAKVFLPEKEKEINYPTKFDSIPNKKLSADFKGQYHSPSKRLIRIQEEDGNIVWRNANRYPITFIQEGKNTYHASYNDQLKIGFFENEMMLFYPSGQTIKYTKLSNNAPTLSDFESFVGTYNSSELDVKFSLTMEGNALMMHLDEWDDKKEVKVLNRNELLINNYILKVERDAFNRVIAMLLTANRALNNRFAKESNLQFQPKIKVKGGTISVTTIGSIDGSASEILLTKNYDNGNEIWSQQYGGSSYDKASSIISTKDGFLIIGSTSSYGNGNYDMFVIKTDQKGNKIWQNTYGDFFNEYGYTAEVSSNGYVIMGTKQNCEGNVFDCTTKVWVVYIDKDGNQLSTKTLEKFN